MAGEKARHATARALGTGAASTTSVVVSAGFHTCVSTLRCPRWPVATASPAGVAARHVTSSVWRPYRAWAFPASASTTPKHPAAYAIASPPRA